MKNLRQLRLIGLLPVAWLMSSCATVSPQGNATIVRPRFHQDGPVDLVLQFYRWDSIYMTMPDTREDGFLPLYSRDDIGREVKRRKVSLNTGVVVISLFYRDTAQLDQLSREWTTYLNEQGFRRVVVLHAGQGKGLDGLPVLSDSFGSSITQVDFVGDDNAAPKVSANSVAPAVASPSGMPAR